MKNFLIYITISLFSWSVNAQYQSLFGDSVTEWKLQEPDIFMGLSDLIYRSDSVIISGVDTFHRVKKSSDNYPHTNEITYIKEDLQTGKYWSYKEDFSVSNLFMDLSLQEGDSMYYFVYSYAYYHVDSVFFDSYGRRHIRFNIPYGTYQLKPKFEMIEGVGTSRGLVQFHSTPAPTPILICHHKNDTLNYQINHPSVQNCHYSTLGIEENTVDFQLFPNPASDQVQLKTEIPIDLSQLVLSDAIGQKIDLNWISEDSFSVNQLQSGLYFMTYSCDGIMVSHPLMVENN